MKMIDRLKAIRAVFKGMFKHSLFKHSIYEVAELNGLAIEYWEGDLGSKFAGHLDETNETPRFIVVAATLSKRDETYVIARGIARYAQQRQVDSLLLDSPLKWALLAGAPAEDRDLLYKLDLEWRTYMLMYWHASKDHFFGYYNQNWGKYSTVSSASNTANFIFFKLRIRRFLHGLSLTPRLFKRYLLSQPDLG